MKFNEIVGDVFEAPEGSVFAQCISQDYKMGAGIAVEFNKRFNLKYKLSRINCNMPDCVFVNNVLNLITKEKYWSKPTYETLKGSLEIMKNICIEKNITEVYMPRLGCGLDKLSWNHVKKTICGVFKDTEIILNVYSKEEQDE